MLFVIIKCEKNKFLLNDFATACFSPILAINQIIYAKLLIWSVVFFLIETKKYDQNMGKKANLDIKLNEVNREICSNIKRKNRIFFDQFHFLVWRLKHVHPKSSMTHHNKFRGNKCLLLLIIFNNYDQHTNQS